jgi:hypothetical protein
MKRRAEGRYESKRWVLKTCLKKTCIFVSNDGKHALQEEREGGVEKVGAKDLPEITRVMMIK